MRIRTPTGLELAPHALRAADLQGPPAYSRELSANSSVWKYSSFVYQKLGERRQVMQRNFPVRTYIDKNWYLEVRGVENLFSDVKWRMFCRTPVRVSSLYFFPSDAIWFLNIFIFSRAPSAALPRLGPIRAFGTRRARRSFCLIGIS